ncbi:hypothetical protein C0J52_07362 [Blattella germanica]|nr:hypothetical protein C0J52_07362 [Blattella germanica]
MVFCFCDEFKFFLIATRIFLTEIMSLLYIQNPFGSCNRALCQLTAWPRCNLFAEKFLCHFPHPHSLLEKKTPEELSEGGWMAGKLDAR